jgi:hypothetical protein
MTHYDVISPWIVIHAPGEPSAQNPQTRYTAGKFPGVIDGRPLDDVLLQLWMGSRQGDEISRFLYFFRIIEYASFSYLDGQARSEIRRILAAPNALDDIGAVTEQAVEAIQKAGIDDYQKCEALFRTIVKPELLWREISNNLDAFSKPIKFDGGFVLEPLVPADQTETQFRLKGIQNFHRSAREIRNALAHGKDLKSAGVISPTIRNFDMLRPWRALICVAAAEVIILKNVI